MRHFMIDIETTGISCDHNAMIQLSAVRFDLETGEVDLNFFDQCLLIPPGRYWDENTREWWSNKAEIITDIWNRMQEPEAVIGNFVRWVDSKNVYNPVFWSKPLSFDFAFLDSYFRQFGYANPFHFRTAENMNTFIRARYFPQPAPEWDRILPFEGDAHNGLHDVLHQIKALCAAYEDTK